MCAEYFDSFLKREKSLCPNKRIWRCFRKNILPVETGKCNCNKLSASSSFIQSLNIIQVNYFFYGFNAKDY